MTEAVEPRSGFEVEEGSASLDKVDAVEQPSDEDLAVGEKEPYEDGSEPDAPEEQPEAPAEEEPSS